MFKRVSRPISTYNRVLSLLASVVAISAALIGGSGSAQAESQDRLPELIKITGADAGFDTMAEELKQSIRKEVSQDPKLANNLSAMEGAIEAIDKIYAPDILKRMFLQSFTGRLTAADIDALIDFYKTPLGMRMAAMESWGSEAERLARFAAKSAEVNGELKNDPKRAEALKQLERSLHKIDAAVDTALAATRFSVFGLSGGNKKALSSVDCALKSMRPMLEKQVSMLVVSGLGVTYREASLTELNEYIEFLSSPLGQKFVNASHAAEKTMISKVMYELGQAVGTELRKERT